MRPVVGVLLAAGSGSRFGGDKLLAVGPDGVPVGLASLRTLQRVLDSVVVVVRPGDDALGELLGAQGARITACPCCAHGIGESLAWGVRATPLAAGWLIALGDMPWVRPQSEAAVVQALRQGATLAAPTYRGTRGHPAGFAASCFPALVTQNGDEGARTLFSALAGEVRLIEVDDPGIVRDVDTPADLA